MQASFYETLFLDHPDPMWIYDTATLGFLAVNHAAIARYGYTREEFLGMTLRDIRPPEDLGQLERVLQTYDGQAAATGVWRHRHKNGAIIYVDIRTTPVEFQGRSSKLVTVRDVSAQVALELERIDLIRKERDSRSAAEASARYFQSLFEALPGKFLVLRPGDYEITAVSDAYLQATMTRREDIKGRLVFDAFPDDPQEPLADGTRALRASLARVELTGLVDVMPVQRYPIARPAEAGGGFEERFWSSINTPVKGPDGTLVCIVHRVEDVTEYVRMAGQKGLDIAQNRGMQLELEILKRSRELGESNVRLLHQEVLFRNARRLVNMGTWELRLDSGQLSWSDNLYHIFGIAPGTDLSVDMFLALVHPDDVAALQRRQQKAISARQIMDLTHRIVRPDGSIRHVREVAEVLELPSGAVLAGVAQDISEQVEARRASEELGRRLQDTLESISDAFFLLDEHWRFRFINQEFSRIILRDRDELLGRHVWECFPEAKGTLFQTMYEQAVATGQKVSFVECFMPLQRWLRVNAYPGPEGLAVYFQDITDQMARDEQLRLLELAVNRQNDILLITEAEPLDGPDGPRIVYVNDAFVRQTGFTREEAIGRSPRILQGPGTSRAELDRIRAALEQWQPVRAELLNYTKSGKELWLEVDIVPMANDSGWFTHWVAIERNITGRKRSQEAVRISNERFASIARATNDIVWDWDLAADTVWWNESYKSLTGHDPAAAGQSSQLWTDYIHDGDRQRVIDGITAVINGKDSTWRDEYRYLCADGRTVNVIDRGFVIRDEQGRALRMIGSMVDVTENRELSQKLAQTQKLESLGQLTGGVAHDFNNLLTVILGNAETLVEQLVFNPQLRQLAQLTARAADRGAELTNRLLAFARRQVLEPKVIDINTLLSGMDGLLRRTLNEDISVEIIRSEGLWLAEIDPGQLEVALLNLAINARDAMPQGGSLLIETANVRLDDEYARDNPDVKPGQYVMVSVTDTGSGMPPEIVARVFEPFFTTKEAGKGSGLGLSMVYGFVKQSGGYAKIYTEPQEGTTIRLYLPRALQQHAADDSASTAEQPSQGGSETILVVEDDAHVREHVCGLLRGLGYDVLCTENGAMALDVLQSPRHIDLLFTDVIMPGGISGKQLADRAAVLRPGLKVLFTSGYTQNSIVHNGRLDPGVELLGKPYRKYQLAAKVRKVLDAE